MRQRLRFPPLYCLRWIRYLIPSRNTSYKLVVLPVSSIFIAVFNHPTHDIGPRAHSRYFVCLLSANRPIYPLFLRIKNCIKRFLTANQRWLNVFSDSLDLSMNFLNIFKKCVAPLGIGDARGSFCQCISFCYSPRGGDKVLSQIWNPIFPKT